MTPERRLIWKIDMLLMPILTVAFGLQFYDKAVLGSASVFGIIEDLGLSTTVDGKTSTERYSTANAAFYYGYIVAVLPIALILQRLPLIKTLSAFVFTWGLVCLLTICVTNYPGLVVQRFFLGLVESSVSPGFVALTSLWYTKEEQTARLGFWYAATGIFSMFSGVVNYGIGHADNGSLATWKYMYIFAGLWTIVHAVVLYAFVPESPERPGRWFSEEEKVKLKQRLASNMTGTNRTHWKKKQFIEALLDPKCWIFMLSGAAIYVCNGGVTVFGARIIRSFGYTSLQAILLQVPGGAMTCIFIWVFGWFAGRYKNIRTHLLAISCLPIIVGACMIWKGDWNNRLVPLWGYYFLPTFGTPYVLILSLAAANVAGGTKKAMTNGMIFIGYNIGNIVGGYVVFTPEAPEHYPSTWIALIVCMCFVIISAYVLRYILAKENKKRGPVEGIAPDLAEIPEMTKTGKDISSADIEKTRGLAANVDPVISDLTDFEEKNFRYVL